MKTTPLRRLLVSLFLVSLFLPGILLATKTVGLRFENKSLNGIVTSAQRPAFSMEEWLNGRFQQQLATWFSENFGGRAALIRLSNQVYYDLFSGSYMNNKALVIGKQKVLYEIDYIQDFIGISPAHSDAVMDHEVDKLAQLQRKMNARGIPFLILITPSKALVYPEHIPDVFFQHKANDHLTSYEKFLKRADRAGLHYVDGNAISVQAKQEAPAPVFPRGGTHWNKLTAAQSVAGVIASLEKLSGERLPHISPENIQVQHAAEGEDKDLADLLNLIEVPNAYPVPSATYAPQEQTAPKKSILFIGDSFGWAPLDVLHEAQVFQRIDFNYYYRTLRATYMPGQAVVKSPVGDVAHIDWEKDMLNHDFVVLLMNSRGMVGGHVTAFVNDALGKLADDRQSPR